MNYRWKYFFVILIALSIVLTIAIAISLLRELIQEGRIRAFDSTVIIAYAAVVVFAALVSLIVAPISSKPGVVRFQYSNDAELQDILVCVEQFVTTYEPPFTRKIKTSTDNTNSYTIGGIWEKIASPVVVTFENGIIEIRGPISYTRNIPKRVNAQIVP